MNEPLPQPSAPGETHSVTAQATRLVSTYADMILRLCYTRLNSTQDAEDLCQTVLLRLLTKAPAFEGANHERAWIIRTTINACNDLARSNARKATVPLEQVAEPSYEPPDRAADAEDTPSRITRAVAQLPHDQRLAIELYYYEGLSIAQVADAVDATESTIAKRLSRARAALRKILTT